MLYVIAKSQRLERSLYGMDHNAYIPATNRSYKKSLFELEKCCPPNRFVGCQPSKGLLLGLINNYRLQLHHIQYQNGEFRLLQ